MWEEKAVGKEGEVDMGRKKSREEGKSTFKVFCYLSIGKCSLFRESIVGHEKDQEGIKGRAHVEDF